MERVPNEVQELAHSVFAMNGRLVSAGNQLVEHLGLTSALWQVLAALHYADEMLPAAAIARRMGLTRQGVQRVLDILEEKNLIEFRENPHHQRAKLVSLTAKGKKAIGSAERAVKPLDQKIISTLGPRKLREAAKTISELTAIITNHLEEEKP